MKLVNQLVTTHLAWTSSANSPGTTLMLDVTPAEKGNFDVQLRTSGMPANGRYEVISWPLNRTSPSTVLKEIQLDNNGLAICGGSASDCGGAASKAPIVIHIQPSPGEPIRLGIWSENHLIKALAKVVILPLRGMDKGCEVSATLIMPGAAAVLFEASGFEQNERLEIHSSSGTEAKNNQNQADGTGRFQDVVLPYASGSSHGEITLTISSHHCSPSVTVPWGTR